MTCSTSAKWEEEKGKGTHLVIKFLVEQTEFGVKIVR
jgi:hypothetical protein